MRKSPEKQTDGGSLKKKIAIKTFLLYWGVGRGGSRDGSIGQDLEEGGIKGLINMRGNWRELCFVRFWGKEEGRGGD